MNYIEKKVVRKLNSGIKPVLRFPPEPNSPGLHIGHAKSICLNFSLAEKYGGLCNLRFDDTNPLVEKDEYKLSIIEDINWLGFKPSNIFNASDYFDFMYESAMTLIKKGLAYVDDSTSEEIAAMKGDVNKVGINSPYRNRTISENIALFKNMKGGFCTNKVLRAKIDMESDNLLLRDPVIYRIIDNTVYPMYDFAHPLSDYKEGISDSLCTLEFELHRPLYDWFLEKLDLTNLPEQTEFSRLNITYNVMSKRKINFLIDEGYIEDWDDPRLMTLKGLRRRGYTAEAIKNFCEIISVTKRDSLIETELLDDCLRKDLNKRALRYYGVIDPVLLTITNWDKGEEMTEVRWSPEKDLGTRLVPFSGSLYIEREDFREVGDDDFYRLVLGGEVRLKGAYIIKANEIVKNSEGNIIEIRCTYDPETKSGSGNNRKTKSTIHWLATNNVVNIPVYEYDKLFNEKEVDKNFPNNINTNSLIINNKALFEKAILDYKDDIAVQIMRKGYYKIENNKIIKTIELKK